MTKTLSLYTLLFALLVFLFSCGEHQRNESADNVLISGYIIGIQDTVAILEKYGGQQVEEVSRVEVINDSFLFNYQMIKGTAYQIRFEALVIPFVYEGEPIKIHSENPDLSCLKMEGAPATVALLEFLEKIDMYNSQIGLQKMSLDSVAKYYENTDSLYQLAKTRLDNKELELNTMIKSYLDTVPYFPLIELVIGFLNPNNEINYFEELSKSIPKRFPNNNDADSFSAAFIKNINQIKNAGLKLGQFAPDFALNNDEGNEVQLSSLKGQYVFLDFWASNCTPCKGSIKDKMYLSEHFKEMNFIVVSVALDQNLNKWKKTIVTDEQNWINLIEPQGWDSELTDLYEIEKIPTNYLIDPNGKIIAKNMSVHEVENKLNEIFMIRISGPGAAN